MIFSETFLEKVTVKTPEIRWQITTRRSQKKDMKIDGE
jgi:hypothetical protein